MPTNQRSYLDDLFQVYPTIPEGIRDIDLKRWNEIEIAFKNQDNTELISHLLRLQKFPLKNSYVSFLRKDPSSLLRNPQTVNRLAGTVYEMGLSKLYERCTEPKETNTQMGPMFSRWVHNKSLGIKPVAVDEFMRTNENAILGGNDAALLSFAFQNFGYNKEKGLDFIARFNGKYILGEAKFMNTFRNTKAIFFDNPNLSKKVFNKSIHQVLILDGLVYRNSEKLLKNYIRVSADNSHIVSSLVFREFLYSI